MRSASSLLFSLVLATCTMPANNTSGAGGTGAVQLTVDRSSYRAGDPIVLTLSNRSAQQIGYNLCGSALERRSGSDWRETTERLAEVCTMELRTLAPNANDTYRHTLPSGLAAGEYRVRTNVESPLGGNFTAVVSGAFQLR